MEHPKSITTDVMASVVKGNGTSPLLLLTMPVLVVCSVLIVWSQPEPWSVLWWPYPVPSWWVHSTPSALVHSVPWWTAMNMVTCLPSYTHSHPQKTFSSQHHLLYPRWWVSELYNYCNTNGKHCWFTYKCSCGRLSLWWWSLGGVRQECDHPDP